jgi:hypothetical protein
MIAINQAELKVQIIEIISNHQSVIKYRSVT